MSRLPTPPAEERGKGHPVREALVSLGACLAKLSEKLGSSRFSNARAKERFRAMFEKNEDGMLLLRKGRLAEVNRQAEKIFGIDRSALLGRSTDVLGMRDRDGAPIRDGFASYMNAVLEGYPQRFNAAFGRKDGSSFEAEVFVCASLHGGRRAALAIVRDISVERGYQKENRRLALALEQAGEAIVIMDTRGRLLYVNRAFEQGTGFRREEILGKDMRFLKSGHHDREFYRKLWETLAQGQTWRGRLVNRRKDGSLYTDEASVTPLRDKQGRISCYIGVSRDITRELELESQLNHASKMEAVGRLAGGVAHDFNNILQIVTGNVELAGVELGEDHPATAYIREIGKAGERATTLVRQLLAFSRKSMLQLRPVEANELLAGMTKMVRRIIGEDIALSFRGSPGRLVVRADESQIEQVIMNLCVNARDAMRDGGRITIETERLELDASYCEIHPDAKPGRYVAISVSDTGCGIAPSLKPRIFEPFFTTKEVGKGTGLGLATVYAIVQRHNGCINVYSEVGIGTTFRIYLPLSSEAEPSGVAPGREEAKETRGKGETILVAEDDEQVLEIARKILESSGYAVVEARNGEQVLELYEKLGSKIGLVLLDVVMPRLNGRQTYELLRQCAPGLPVVFATGYSYHHLQDELLKNVRILRKPFTPRELLETIRKALDGRPRAGA